MFSYVKRGDRLGPPLHQKCLGAWTKLPAANQHSHRLRIAAILNYQHLLLSGAKGQLTHGPSPAQLLGRKLFEPGHNPDSPRWRARQSTLNYTTSPQI